MGVAPRQGKQIMRDTITVAEASPTAEKRRDVRAAADFARTFGGGWASAGRERTDDARRLPDKSDTSKTRRIVIYLSLIMKYGGPNSADPPQTTELENIS